MAKQVGELAALPPGELLKGIQEIAAALRFKRPLTEPQQAQAEQLITHLAGYATDVFTRMQSVEDEVHGLAFHSMAAKHLILAEISRYFTLVDPEERAKCWDKLHRALVDRPPRETHTPGKDAVRIGGHSIEAPNWLSED